MKQRFEFLRRCKNGRICKERAARASRKSPTRIDLHSCCGTARSKRSSLQTIPSAFKNYAPSSDNGSRLLGADLMDSQPVASSMLLLDGSSLPISQVNGRVEKTRIPRLDRPSYSPYPATLSNISGEISTSTSLGPTTPSEAAGRASNRFSGLWKLSDKTYSESYLRHISSVLRYSSSNSWRSSLASFSSRVSSLFSGSSIPENHHPEHPIHNFHIDPSSPDDEATSNEVSSEGFTSTEITEKDLFPDVDQTFSAGPGATPFEDEMWDELVNEDSLDCNPLYLVISPLNRECCPPMSSTLQPAPLKAYQACVVCGLSSEHRRALDTGTVNSKNKILVNLVDFYGNTPFHCAAASLTVGGFEKFISMAEEGKDFTIRNTSGQNALHILFQNGLRIAREGRGFLRLLKLLANNPSFQLLAPDYHGRTPLHHLFHHVNGNVTIPASILSEILDVMQPPFALTDNSGNSVLSLCDEYNKARWQSSVLYYNSVPTFSGQFSLSSEDQSEPEGFVPQVGSNQWSVESIQRSTDASKGMTWVDCLGDTPLTAFLKSEQAGEDEEDSVKQRVEHMIGQGAEIHMRDRKGDTALAIAARRGFRTIVTLLLKKGSNANCRNYRRVGLLRQTMKSMREAWGNDRLWAMIYSCHIALIDAGATSDPTDEDEWMLPRPKKPSAKSSSKPRLPKLHLKRSPKTSKTS